MNARGLGMVLLCSHLGDPGRPVLTSSRLMELERRVLKLGLPGEGQVTPAYLLALGCGREEARHICGLLSQEALAIRYLERAGNLGIRCLTRNTSQYPRRLREALGDQAPAVLWCRGDESLLNTAAIGVAGSRDASAQALNFARSVGRAAAGQNLALVSGGARGCDTAAETGCLEAGGQVIRVLPDRLDAHPVSRQGLLLLCEDSYDLPFSAHRALSRNRIIHSLGAVTVIAQSGLRGGTWDGTMRNLNGGWSRVCVPEDRSPAAQAFLAKGACLLRPGDLQNLASLADTQTSLF